MRHLVLGTAGHIDHGKSALVQALTGINPDRLKEEQARGITIDLGFAHLDLDGSVVAFVDVPGHERFVKNMLAGATGVDGVVLIVAADESVMPQTREHFDICRLLGVSAGIIVLTKRDLVDALTLDIAASEVRDLVRGSFLDGAPIVAVSARTGQGLDELRAVLSTLAASVTAREAAGVVRLPVDRAFTMRGFGTVVTGTLVSGEMTADTDLELLPDGRRVRVRGLQGHGRSLVAARAGQRVAVNLTGIEVAEVARGRVLASPGVFAPTRRLDAYVELLPGAKPLAHAARVRFHQGTGEFLGRVAIAAVDGARSPLASGPSSDDVRAIPAGGHAWVRIRLESPAVLTRGDRFILRAYSPSVTIGGGLVLDPDPPAGALRSNAARSRLAQSTPATALASAEDAGRAVLAMLASRGLQGMSERELIGRAGLTPSDARAMTSRLERSGQAVAASDRWMSADVVLDAERRILATLDRHHAADPTSDGLSREAVRAAIGRAVPVPVFEAIVRRLVDRGRMVARERLASAAHKPAVSVEDARLFEAIESVFRAAALNSADTAAVARQAGAEGVAVERAIHALVKKHTLVRVESLVFHRTALERLKADVAAMKSEGIRTIDVAGFKARYGLTRKFAIPLLEYLDRERVTRRAGEVRQIV